jgi:hypothetical protein
VLVQQRDREVARGVEVRRQCLAIVNLNVVGAEVWPEAVAVIVSV